MALMLYWMAIGLCVGAFGGWFTARWGEPIGEAMYVSARAAAFWAFVATLPWLMPYGWAGFLASPLLLGGAGVCASPAGLMGALITRELHELSRSG
ncbi:MAG: hypothetical protein GC159_06780 [Phycisphaera sp.]|nr:hypothetical protein [Phycisphaera sp.]